MVRLLLLGALVFTMFACSSTPEPPEAPPPAPPVAEAAPPQPAPEVVSRPAVRELPKTASSLPALGLSGLAALAGAGALRWVRTRIR